MNGTQTTRRLTKSRTDRMLDGVCGGIADYFGIDPTIIRIIWVLLVFFGGAGVVLYILAMIIMPAAPIIPGAPLRAPAERGSHQKFWGMLLVVLGALLLIGNFGFPFWHHAWDFSWEVMLAVLLIVAGGAFIAAARRPAPEPPAAPAAAEGEAPPPPFPPLMQRSRLQRSRSDRKLFGVCGGLAAYFDTDPTIVRLLFVLALFASFGVALLAYIVMAILVPEERILPLAG